MTLELIDDIQCITLSEGVFCDGLLVFSLSYTCIAIHYLRRLNVRLSKPFIGKLYADVIIEIILYLGLSIFLQEK